MDFRELSAHIDALLREIDVVFAVAYDDKISWDDKYCTAFTHYRTTLKKMIDPVGLDFELYTYGEGRQADVTAYLDALRRYAERLKGLRVHLPQN